jgi:hypothetical protein
MLPRLAPERETQMLEMLTILDPMMVNLFKMMTDTTTFAFTMTPRRGMAFANMNIPTFL